VTKPRKAPVKKKKAADAAEPVVVIHPTHDQIATLAHQFWAERDIPMAIQSRTGYALSAS